MKAKTGFAKGIIFVLAALLCMSTAFAAENGAADTVLIMQVDNPMMTVNGTEAEIDPGRGTAPDVAGGHPLFPIRAIMEAYGGTAEWVSETQGVRLTHGENVIDLLIGKTEVSFNGEAGAIDVAPMVINGRTKVSVGTVEYIADAFRLNTAWNAETQTLTIRPYVGTSEFDFEKRTVLLNNGVEMPILGIGTFTLSQEQAENSVYHALLDGYRLIDTASAYGNEEGVGKGIVRSGVPREEIFVTTKLWPSAYNMEGIDACLEKLGLEYVDLMLLHQPMGDYIGGYKAMEQAVAEGKIRCIGVSNFTEEQFEEIMEIATIPPVVNQVETHPYNQQYPMIDFLDKYGTVIEAWFPLGGRGNTQVLFADPTIVEIAEAHGKTSAQIILRWHLQAGHIAIPGSSNPDHILENISIFDFELTDEEMAKLKDIDKADPFFGGFGSNEEAESAGDRWGLDT